jgi:putative holliday junction resolvase
MPDGVILAFDFGTQRIGVAVGEMMLGHARPLTTLAAASNDARFSAIAKLIAEWQPARLVVGLPRSLDGEEHEMTDRCRRFARQLEGRYRLPVAMVDERLSSAAAEEGLRDRGVSWQDRKSRIDAEAAAILLQSYFDESQHELATSRR